MSQPILRTIKLRSEEQQTLNKTYNKSTLVIPQDALYSTDMSQSYLNLKLKIKTNNNQEITTADLLHLKEKDLSICFGNGSLEYSPACLIKHCVLKRGDGAIIESIPFSNIISQTMFQFQNNKESVSNKSLLNGMCFESNALTGSISSIVKNPIQVQIPLKDIFESCKSSNWWMSETKGCIISLEFEDKKNLMKLSKINSNVSKVENLVDSNNNTFNLKPSLQFNDLLSFETGEYFNTVADENTTTTLQQPLKMVLDRFEYFNNPNLNLLQPNTQNIPYNRTLYFNNTHKDITIEQVNSLGLNVNDNIEMVYMNTKYTGINKNISIYNKITAFNPYVAPVPAVAPVLSYTDIGGGTGGTVPAEWTSAPATYLLNGAVATDIKTDVAIDPTTGVYSLVNTVWAAPPGDASKDTAQYIIPKEVLGAGNTVDLTITLTAYQANPPTFTIAGAAQPVPAATPEVDEVNANFTLKNSVYSDDPANNNLMKINLIEPGDGNCFLSYLKTDNNLIENLKNNKLIVNTTAMDYLRQKGLVSDTYEKTDSCFDLVIQNEYEENVDIAAMVSAGLITTLAPEYIDNNKVYSNSAIMLPNTGRKVKINKITIDGANYILEFSNLNIKEDFGFTFSGVNRTANTAKWAPSAVDIPGVKIGFVNFQKMVQPLTEPTLRAKISEGLTYDIDLLEIVLQQQTKNKKMPMPKIYTTYAVEPFSIENNQYQFEKQFNITQPNVYNIALIMVDDNSLISSCMDRNVFSYRYQINNVSNTSTDINLKSLISDYPSSLHIDKQLDYFSNSNSQMKTMFGFKGLENVAVVPSILPLKIYTANDTSSFYSNPAGFSLQLALNSNELAGFIKSGSCYLLKSVIKSM